MAPAAPFRSSRSRRSSPEPQIRGGQTGCQESSHAAGSSARRHAAPALKCSRAPADRLSRGCSDDSIKCPSSGAPAPLDRRPAGSPLRRMAARGLQSSGANAILDSYSSPLDKTTNQPIVGRRGGEWSAPRGPALCARWIPWLGRARV